MHIVIAGGSGFLGSALARALTGEGHDVAILTRQESNRSAPPHLSFVPWTPDGSAGPWARVVDGASAVDQSCRRIDRRQTLVRYAENDASGQPPARHWKPDRRHSAGVAPARSVYQRLCGRVLRRSRRGNTHRILRSRHGLSCQPRQRLGGGCQRRIRRHAGGTRPHGHCPRPSGRRPAEDARRRSRCLPEAPSARAGNTCRGFTRTTGFVWCRG